MNELDYNSIKRKIESQKCAEHNQNPQFIKTSKGFEIKACCENFRSQLVKKAEKIIADETQKAIEKMMKKYS
ncbi:hypothetical protein [Chryseobacterium takakiae]|uniref:Uncharacterized protein n=1 Tax=Chryseobacterium takakiae TaxID=1302685 RepID=A0A1M4XFZ9_9FLAO|nr:hypothetical protein [Chryseobacterium takakiae]SHE92320.1 hypothetical protein SAMN05444408_10640 [Chryseobacterium takakiae]